MNLPADFAFTQGSLGDFDDCPRRFELRHLRQLRYPTLEAEPALKFEARTRQGARFHKLVQQHLLGVPADLLARSLSDDEELERWWADFRATGLTELPAQRHVEMNLQTTLAGRRLIAKYDLIALETGGDAIIVDWKTWRRIPPRQRLASRMQTVLYRYVLAQAGAHLYGGRPIPPEKIRMIYCFVAVGGQRSEFAYSADAMRADEAFLLDLIRAIETADEFPLTDAESRCRFCNFRSLCERGEAGQVDLLDEFDDEEEEAFELDFDQIAEIEF